MQIALQLMKPGVVFILCLSKKSNTFHLKEYIPAQFIIATDDENAVAPYSLVPSLQWRNNGRDDISNLQRLDGLLNRLFRSRLKEISKLRVTGLCEFPSQRDSNEENDSIWWRHHD